jgi:hypothetical protein
MDDGMQNRNENHGKHGNTDTDFFLISQEKRIMVLNFKLSTLPPMKTFI